MYLRGRNDFINMVQTLTNHAPNSSTGLVLEGGGMRGLFTAGVIDVFLENGITFPNAVGVSAGACFGVNLKTEQIGRALRYNIQMAGNPHYMSLRSLLLTGDYVNAEFCYHTIPTQIDVVDTKTFLRNPMRFHIVCTDIDTGEAVYHELTDLDYDNLEWIRASASLPIVSRPVLRDGRRLMDGGMADSIPLQYSERLGYRRNVVILTQPFGFRKEPARHPWLFQLFCGRYPAMVNSLTHRAERYNACLEQIERQAVDGTVLLITPPRKLDIGRIEQNPDKLHAIYQLGRQTCLAQLDQIKEYIKASEA